jgi:hypothetical protein
MGLNAEEDRTSVTAIFRDHSGVEKAIHDLRDSGLDIEKLSIVEKDFHAEDHVAGFNNRSERIRYSSQSEPHSGECWSGLAGVVFLIIPGLGPTIVAGPVAGWIISALEGSIFVGGLSALGAGLVTLGIPRRTVFKYEIAIKAGKLILITFGNDEDAKKAEKTLQNTAAEEIYTNAMPPEPARVA